jgi:hypothetical protein
VRSRGERFQLTAKEARIAANIDAMVAEAVARGRDGNVVTRAFRNLTGGEIQADIDPEISYSSEAVGRLVSRVKRRTERDARDAKVDFSATGLKKVDGRDGLKVDKQSLRRKVESALLQSSEDERVVTAKVQRVKPKVTTAQLEDKYGTVVTVDRSNFTLRLFKGLKLRKSYRIAVGKVGLDTPAGLYNIQNKAVNPAWNVPNSDWAGDLAGRSSRAARPRTRSRRGGWASTTASASTARPSAARSARTPRTAASACSSRTSPTCTTTCPSARRSTSPSGVQTALISSTATSSQPRSSREA